MGNIFQADQIHIQPQFFSHYHQMGKHNAEIQLFKFPQMVHIVLFCKHMDPVIVYHKPPWLAVHAGWCQPGRLQKLFHPLSWHFFINTEIFQIHSFSVYCFSGIAALAFAKGQHDDKLHIPFPGIAHSGFYPSQETGSQSFGT